MSSSRDIVSNTAVRQHPLRGTGGSEVNDETPSRADSGSGSSGPSAGGIAGAPDPCKLVPASRAQAILGATAPAQEAPLGPTCIYRRGAASDFVTVSIESTDFGKLAAHLRHRRRVDIAGRTAVCGDYGHQTTLVRLGGDRVLNVAAPCSLGERFAAAALPRLKN